MSVRDIGPNTRGKDASQTLARGLRALDWIAESGRPSTIREVALGMKLPRSVVQRLISTLETAGYVERDASEGGYCLSLKAWSLGCAAVRRLDVREVAHPILQALSARSKETVKLGVLAGAHVITMDSLMSEKTVRAYIPVGGRAPARISATGRAILAFMSPHQLARHGYGEDGPNALAPSLNEELSQIRRRGYAVNRGEMSRDTSALAAPVFDAHGDVAASVGIIMPSNRLTTLKMEQMGIWVTQAGAEISAQLGYMSREAALT